MNIARDTSESIGGDIVCRLIPMRTSSCTSCIGLPQSLEFLELEGGTAWVSMVATASGWLTARRLSDMSFESVQVSTAPLLASRRMGG